ncbi:hypothetical protein ABZ656_43405 [Streptomyces sp. NPDC007095]|uniref:hypothetical protein n=1 Tax=Streptomyces sp. NPDC007095 TaxID=3154482 RepID=UPI0033F1FF87
MALKRGVWRYIRIPGLRELRLDVALRQALSPGHQSPGAPVPDGRPARRTN